MTGAKPALSPARRDGALRRTRLANRGLVGAMIALTAILAEFAAKAFPGHARSVAPAAAAVRHPARTHRGRASRAGTAHRRHHSAHHSHPAALKPPAQAPTSAAPPATSAPAPAATTPAPAATTPAPAPVAPAPAPASSAPAVSGGS